MSTIPSLGKAHALREAYQALSQGFQEPESIIRGLQGLFRESILDMPSQSLGLPRRELLQMTIQTLAHNTYSSALDDPGRDKINRLFYKLCGQTGSSSNMSYLFSGISSKDRQEWGKRHVYDTDKVLPLLQSLQILSLENEVLNWAGRDANRQVAAERIMTFMTGTGNTLDLKSLRLTSLPDIFDNTQMKDRLHRLDLSSNQLTSLPESITTLTRLKILKVHYNELTSIPESIGRLTFLTELHLYSNQLTSLPASIEMLTSLRYLSVFYNQLISLPASIERLTSLELLEVSYNQLTSLPASIGRLTSLTELHVSHNQLTSLPASIGRLTSLTELHVSHNQLTSLPESIVRLSSLRKIDISINYALQPVPRTVFNLPRACTVILDLSLNFESQFYSVSSPMQRFNWPRFIALPRSDTQAPRNLDKYLEHLKKTKGSENIHHEITRDATKKNSLESFLSRLNDIQANGRENIPDLHKKILSYVELAEIDEPFREKFFHIIEGASATCGDRMALSVLHLGIQHRMIVMDKSDLKELAEFLIHGPWMLERLEECARTKIASLGPSFKEHIEVYLGFPIKLKEKLQLQIDPQDMLFGDLSKITDTDLENAASYIQDQISTLDDKASILVQREDWIQALEKKRPVAMANLQIEKNSGLNAIEDDNLNDYRKVQDKYMEDIISLTKETLSEKKQKAIEN